MSLVAAMQVPQEKRDLGWLRSALQVAIEIEHSTLPPYLAALWSIKKTSEPAYGRIRRIALQEMLHMGLACNMLSAIGGTPALTDPAFMPSYPGPLPQGVHPGLIVGLEPLSHHALETFMKIEEPDPATPPPEGGFPTIGLFYDAIHEALSRISPPIRTSYQVTADSLGGYPLFQITAVKDALVAIDQIKRQGEGTPGHPPSEPSSPLRAPNSNIVAHYFRFGEILHGHEYVEQDGTWNYVGPPVPFPADIYPMAPVPAEGYPSPPPELLAFNKGYTAVLQALQKVWTTAEGGDLNDEAVPLMLKLRPLAVALMKKNLPGSNQTYGPTFKFVP